MVTASYAASWLPVPHSESLKNSHFPLDSIHRTPRQARTIRVLAATFSNRYYLRGLRWRWKGDPVPPSGDDNVTLRNKSRLGVQCQPPGGHTVNKKDRSERDICTKVRDPDARRCGLRKLAGW